MHQGMFFGLRPVDAERATGPDRFDPFRVGLDHLSFSVPTRADLDAAVRLLDERGVEHGPIRELVALGLCFLAFFDPDGIALELTAPISDRPYPLGASIARVRGRRERSVRGPCRTRRRHPPGRRAGASYAMASSRGASANCVRYSSA